MERAGAPRHFNRAISHFPTSLLRPARDFVGKFLRSSSSFAIKAAALAQGQRGLHARAYRSDRTDRQRQRQKCPGSELRRDNLCHARCTALVPPLCVRPSVRPSVGRDRERTGIAIGLKDYAPLRSSFASCNFPSPSVHFGFCFFCLSLFNLLSSSFVFPFENATEAIKPPPQICTTKAFCLPPSL